MSSAWLTWLRRAITSPERLAVLLERYDWPEFGWSPNAAGASPTAEAVASEVTRTRISAETAMRNRLMCRHWWQLWALIDAREAELPELYEAVRRHSWGPYSRRERRRRRGHVSYADPLQLTIDDVARLILDPRCTEATRLMVLRGWGTRLWEAVRSRGG